MNKDIKRHNLKQIKYIEQEIDDYLKNKILLKQLIDNIYLLILQVSDEPDAFFNKLTTPLSWVEISYLDAERAKRDYFTPQELSYINEGIAEIKRLLSNYKSTLANHEHI